jgi:hypothetical protein
LGAVRGILASKWQEWLLIDWSGTVKEVTADSGVWTFFVLPEASAIIGEGYHLSVAVRSTVMVNHFYVYCVDRDFGPFFLKFSMYSPYHAKLCLNGHEYAKQQLAHKGIGFEASTIGF